MVDSKYSPKNYESKKKKKNIRAIIKNPQMLKFVREMCS